MKILRTLLALLLLAVPLAAGAQTFPKLSGRVVDAANLLSPEQEAQLRQLSEQVEQASSRQFVVATIPSLEDYPIEDYGYRLARAWKIGQAEANNGILLLVAPNERRVRIEVGYGLEPIMTDALSSTIINGQILPRFKAGDMPGGILAGAQAIAEQMKLPLEAAEARAKAQTDQAAAHRTNRSQRSSSGGGGGLVWGLIFFGIILFAVIIPMLSNGLGRRGRQGPWGTRRYRRGDDGSALPIILWTIASELSRGSGGGSGWGGGGGGGWGGGGGGGGFSGGGGSFGGGGASGEW